MSGTIIEMRHITKRFPGIVANDDVSIAIRKGEVYALLGENGAGKSTLMSILFGMYEPDQGEILVNGKPAVFHSSTDAAACGIGMVHQHFKLVEPFTIAENIVLGVEPQEKKLGVLPWVDMRGANRQISELSKAYGLEVNPTDRIADVPVSVRQRVEILKMLYRGAEIMIFDEPTAVLTPQEIDSLLQIIDNLRRDGKTIILITHKIAEIKRIADRCAIMRQGQLIDIRDVESASAQELADLMVGRQVQFSQKKSAPKYGRPVLEVQHLTVKNEHKFDVVTDVSFTVRSGEIFAIAGVSGNGQGEIADAVAGLVKAASGNVILNGKDITGAPVRERCLAGVSYIPEDRHETGTIPDMTLRENLSLREYFKPPFSSARGILNHDTFSAYAEKLIDAYDIRCAQGPDTVLRSMSGGNQQKAIVGREIEEQNDLIIFVQPTRGLDIGAIENIHRQILQERDRGAAILLISLELDEIMNLADTIGVLYRGKMLKIDAAENMTTQEVGRYMMGVKES